MVAALVRERGATIRRRCHDSDAQRVDFGTPKRRPEDCPALSYFRAGEADARLIVCMPSNEPRPRGVLLTSRALSGFPAGWLAVPTLREVGLLPLAIDARSLARPRTAALRKRRFPARSSPAGSTPKATPSPNAEPGHRTRGDVLKLLRETRSVQPPTLPDEPPGAPAALL